MVEVGPAVKNFNVGDKVVAYIVSMIFVFLYFDPLFLIIIRLFVYWKLQRIIDHIVLDKMKDANPSSRGQCHPIFSPTAKNNSSIKASFFRTILFYRK